MIKFNNNNSIHPLPPNQGFKKMITKGFYRQQVDLPSLFRKNYAGFACKKEVNHFHRQFYLYLLNKFTTFNLKYNTFFENKRREKVSVLTLYVGFQLYI